MGHRRLSVKLGLFLIIYGSSSLGYWLTWSSIPSIIDVSWATTPVSAHVLSYSTTALPSTDQLNASSLLGMHNNSSEEDVHFDEQNQSETAWCILDHDNLSRFYRHFPHTLESLAPCWSYFCRRSDKKCGFFSEFDSN